MPTLVTGPSGRSPEEKGDGIVAAGDAGTVGVADRLGIEPDMTVQELGWDKDVDATVRTAVEERTGSPLLGEDADDVVDVILLWWRDGDGDLADVLGDAIAQLADDSVIWVLNPKTGRSGYVEPSDIAEAATTAGLAQTSSIGVGDNWAGIRLMSRKAATVKR